MDRVHVLISSRPDLFQAIAERLDREYSAEALYARAQEQSHSLKEVASKPRTVPNSRYEGLERLMLSSWIPEDCLEETRTWWDPPLRRWEVVLFNLLQGKLPIVTPGLEWKQPAEALFIYWITCDERAENGPTLSSFQDWPWDQDDVFERATGRCYVNNWPLLNRAVDFGLALAARMPKCPVAAKTAPVELSRLQLGTHGQYRVAAFDLVSPDRPRKTRLVISYGVDREGHPRTALVKGSTQAHLAKMVMEQPDCDHTWNSLLRAGNKSEVWLLTSPASLQRAGRRVRKDLPSGLKGHWSQSQSGVRWSSE